MKLTAALAAFIPLCLPAPTAWAQASVTPASEKAILGEIGTNSQIMPNLTYLCDTIGGRLTGSASLNSATDWAVAKMRAYGLKNVHLEPYTIPEGWERGGQVTARVLPPGNNARLSMAAFAWTPGTSGAVRGPVVHFKPKSLSELDGYKGKLKNAIIIMSDPTPPALLGTRTPDETSVDAVFNNPPPPDPNASVTKAPVLSPQLQVQIFTRSMALFKSEGVSALLFDSGRPLGLLMMAGGWESMGPMGRFAFPVVFTAHEDYTLLLRLADEATLPGGKDATVEINVPSRTIPGPITVNNVVGDLPGTDKADEFVVLGAHLDSWDLAQGATDNGTGSCVVLESARSLVKLAVAPRRTIRFVLFTGEEEGDIGSEAYVAAHKAELAKTSMCLVDDSGTGKSVGLHTQAWTAIPAIFKAESTGALTDLGLTRIVPGSPIPGGGGGSDHDSFEEHGVPGFMLDQLDSGYHLYFHSQVDTLDKADPAALNQTAEVMAILGLRIADLPALLPRAKPAPAAAP